MERRLLPFHPESALRAKVLPIDDLCLEDGFHERLGFAVSSKQWNFLHTPRHSRFVLLLMRCGDDTSSPTDDRTLAVVFGERSGGMIELWHVSVNRRHPLNDSHRGERWGIYGIERVVEGQKTRWRQPGGGKVTARNHTRLVRGTPNPYAVIAVAEVVRHFGGVTQVQQHPEMPCAQLFHKDYDHASHPAIALIYRSLGFRYQVGRYVWYEFMGSMSERLSRLLEAMALGRDGASE